jgi:hypothetical protein
MDGAVQSQFQELKLLEESKLEFELEWQEARVAQSLKEIISLC